VERWVCVVNNTLAGRMLLGPILGTYRFVAGEVGALAKGDRTVITGWVLHGLGLVPVGVWLAHYATMPVPAYLLAVWLGFGLLRIRTFLEHRAHENARSRTVVVEDRGPLSILFLNNNFHAVHHMHPKVAWYDLPDLYASRRDHYLRRNGDYVYRTYGEIFRQYFLRTKDPVAHPIWPVQKRDVTEESWPG
ncbi:MAG: fatty acid desaturase, partial [Candidatus Saccharibacteria bacterium]|nr:fatty acid desaturase [Pseudorhodobacter sp.]